MYEANHPVCASASFITGWPLYWFKKLAIWATK